MVTSRRAKLAALGGVFGMLIACGAMTGCGDDSSNGGTGGTSGTASGSTSGTSGASGADAGDAGHDATVPDSGEDATADATTDTGTADTSTEDSSADTGAKDTGAADTGVADTGAKDTGAADTGMPDTGAADTGMPDTGVDSSMEDAGDAGTDGGAEAAACDTMWPTDGGANIIGNADFESGDTGWVSGFGSGTVGTSTSLVHCGTMSGELSARTASYSMIAYPLPSTATTYNLALWIAQDGQVDGAAGTLNMSVQAYALCGDAGTASYINMDNGGGFPTVPANTFTLVTGTITIPDGCSDVELYVGQNQAQGLTANFPDIYVDDVYAAPQQ